MKLSKGNLRDIRTFARERIGGFGMWIELAEKVGYLGSEQVRSYNLLFKHDERTRDLYDLAEWSWIPKLDIEVIDGFVWLDFAVHDHEELKDYVHVLLNEKGEILKMWRTWANEDELKAITKLTNVY